MNNLDIFSNRSVLVTGHTGFKGSWLCAWLNHLGANVTGIALSPPSVPSHFDAIRLSELIDDHRVDIRDFEKTQTVIREAKPDFVFHLAAQSLVRRSYIEPIETYQTNIQGTLNVLESLRKVDKPCVAIIITSDKCYENAEWIWGYRENDRLGGTDPYSASKSAAEILVHSHVKSFFPENGLVRLGIARAGNVIGGGDWATDRIVPDCVRAWANADDALLRNPHSTRPWQHVLEPLSGYLTLAMALHMDGHLHGEPFNFGPRPDENHSVIELVQAKAKYWPSVKWQEMDQTLDSPKESHLLRLNCDKAQRLLKWQATLSFEEMVRMTSEWYCHYYECPDPIREVTFTQIRQYETLFQDRKPL